jgi:hypothetical protein
MTRESSQGNPGSFTGCEPAAMMHCSKRTSFLPSAESTQALGVDMSYFFEGLSSDTAFSTTAQQRLLLELTRNFVSIPDRKHREAICGLARALSGAHGPGGGSD